jgi:hypothetical protein
MFEYLELDLETGFRLSATEMRAAMRTCRACGMFHTCDYQVESRYFICPNREFLDRLEDHQDQATGLAGG